MISRPAHTYTLDTIPAAHRDMVAETVRFLGGATINRPEKFDARVRHAAADQNLIHLGSFMSDEGELMAIQHDAATRDDGSLKYILRSNQYGDAHIRHHHLVVPTDLQGEGTPLARNPSREPVSIFAIDPIITDHDLPPALVPFRRSLGDHMYVAPSGYGPQHVLTARQGVLRPSFVDIASAVGYRLATNDVMDARFTDLGAAIMEGSSLPFAFMGINRTGRAARKIGELVKKMIGPDDIA